MPLLSVIPWWLWSVALLVLGLGFFLERLVGELRAIRERLEDITDELAVSKDHLDDEGPPPRSGARASSLSRQ